MVDHNFYLHRRNTEAGKESFYPTTITSQIFSTVSNRFSYIFFYLQASVYEILFLTTQFETLLKLIQAVKVVLNESIPLN